MNKQEIFLRAEALLGNDAMKRIASSRIIIFGVGGVGSWCAEALIRTGVRNLTIVDHDCVCESNINRQLMATTLTIGQPKVEVLRERLLDINPDVNITAQQTAFTEDNANTFSFDQYDYVVDAIDSVKDKVALILHVCKSRATLYSSMGAALKTDPTQIKVAEFRKVSGDPLARTLRRRFKHQQTYPEKKFQCVYSDETIEASAVKGSIVQITAIFGFNLASLIINDLTRKSQDSQS